MKFRRKEISCSSFLSTFFYFRFSHRNSRNIKKFFFTETISELRKNYVRDDRNQRKESISSLDLKIKNLEKLSQWWNATKKFCREKIEIDIHHARPAYANTQLKLEVFLKAFWLDINRTETVFRYVDSNFSIVSVFFSRERQDEHKKSWSIDSFSQRIGWFQVWVQRQQKLNEDSDWIRRKSLLFNFSPMKIFGENNSRRCINSSYLSVCTPFVSRLEWHWRKKIYRFACCFSPIKIKRPVTKRLNAKFQSSNDEANENDRSKKTCAKFC